MATPATQSPIRRRGEGSSSRDFRQEVTDSIVQLMEKGVAPWQKPWEPGSGSLAIPFNPTSERAYRGGNAIHLMATALQKGYEDPRWMTYKQAADQGWQVRKGEKGTQIEFWEKKPVEREDQMAGTPGSKNSVNGDKSRFIHRVYTVFNATQIDNATKIDHVPAYSPVKRSEFEAVHAGEQILANSGAKIVHDQADRAFYSRSRDAIHLPAKDTFKDVTGYYGTALHELGHWTGHPSRLNRGTLNESYRFGDLNYAKEELRAELASVFLAAERGIPHNPEQHAAYVGSWIKALKEDKNEIFRAAHDASVAADFLLTLERDRSVAEDELATVPGVESAPGGSAVATLERTTAEMREDRERLDDQQQEAAANAFPAKTSLLEAQSVTGAALGPKAKALAAQTESGAYRGAIIGETDQFVIQRQSSRFSVAHPKDLLDRQPEVGESVSINYSGLGGSVREYRERSRTQQRER
jgi:antirestriction protein ArdC